MLAQNMEDKLSVGKTTVTLQQGEQTRKIMLEEYTRGMTLKGLQSGVEKAKADELARQADLERAKTAGKSLLKQIEGSKVVAPVAGRVAYGRPFGKGAVVRDGDLLFKLVPEDAPRSK